MKSFLPGITLGLPILVALALTPYFFLFRVPRIRTLVITERSVTKEGAGSILTAHKFAMIIAGALDAELKIPDVMSDHGYKVSKVLALDLTTTSLGSSCISWQRASISKISRLAGQLCRKNERISATRELRHLFKGCETVIFDIEHQGWTGLIEADKCAAVWARKQIKTLFRSRPKRLDKLEIGIHLRLGDLEHSTNFKLFNFSKLQNVVRGIEKCCRNLAFRVATEARNIEKVDQLIPNAAVLNGGDILRPMEWLSGSRVLFASGGTYGLLLAQVLDHELLVVQPSHEVEYSGWENRLSFNDLNDTVIFREICNRYEAMCGQESRIRA